MRAASGPARWRRGWPVRPVSQRSPCYAAHQETPQAVGLSGDGGVVEVLVSPDGDWTMLVSYPKRPTCVVAAGPAWEMQQLAGEPA